MWPIVTIAVWSVRVLVVFVRPVKSGRADQDDILGVDSWEPTKPCVIWRHRSPMGRGSFVGHILASRSRCRFGCGFMGAQKTVCCMEAQIPRGNGLFCGTYFCIKIKMPFWVWIHGSPENCVLYGGADPPWDGVVLWDIFQHALQLFL